MGISQAEAIASIEARYFADYVRIVGLARDYATDALRTAMRADPNDIRRRLHLVNIIALEYAAYEDAAAFLKAWLDWRAGRCPTPLAGIMSYKPGDARLDRVLSTYSIGTGDDLFLAIKASEWLPPDWPSWFPSLNLEKTVRLCCTFLANDCRTNQKRHGVAAYNKIKHGLLVVPSARRYTPSLPDVPAAVFPNPTAGTPDSAHPLVVYAFPSDDAALEERERLVHFVGRSLRLLAALYLLARYPEEVRAVWGTGGHGMFLAQDSADLLELIADVTRK